MAGKAVGTKQTKGPQPADIDERITQLRQAAREANEACQNIREVLREIQQIRRQMPADIKAEYEKLHEKTVKEFLETGQKEVMDAVQSAETAIVARLTRLTASLSAPRRAVPDVDDILVAERVIHWIRYDGARVRPEILTALVEEFRKRVDQD